MRCSDRAKGCNRNYLRPPFREPPEVREPPAFREPKDEHMIVTRAPYRVSFFGGGSDQELFYSKFPGAVLSTSINKFTYISSHYFFDADKIDRKSVV